MPEISAPLQFTGHAVINPGETQAGRTIAILSADIERQSEHERVQACATNIVDTMRSQAQHLRPEAAPLAEYRRVTRELVQSGGLKREDLPALRHELETRLGSEVDDLWMQSRVSGKRSVASTALASLSGAACAVDGVFVFPPLLTESNVGVKIINGLSGMLFGVGTGLSTFALANCAQAHVRATVLSAIAARRLASTAAELGRTPHETV